MKTHNYKTKSIKLNTGLEHVYAAFERVNKNLTAQYKKTNRSRSGGYVSYPGQLSAKAEDKFTPTHNGNSSTDESSNDAANPFYPMHPNRYWVHPDFLYRTSQLKKKLLL